MIARDFLQTEVLGKRRFMAVAGGLLVSLGSESADTN
jgi:hypothetical protein